MEFKDFISVFQQSSTSLFIWYASSSFQISDVRANASMIQIISAIFTLTLGIIIKIFLQGGWRKYYYSLGLYRFFNQFQLTQIKHTDFNPDDFPVPNTFCCSVIFTDVYEVDTFCTWVLDNHSNKFKDSRIVISDNLLSIYNKATKRNVDDIDEESNFVSHYNSSISTVRKILENTVPIWYGSDGCMVYATKNMTQIKNDDISSRYEPDYTFCLLSNSTIAINEVVEHIMRDSSMVKKQEEKDSKLDIFRTSLSDNSPRSKIELKKTGKINSRKNFKTLHFEKKNTLISLLDKLRKGKIGSELNGLENKLGILLHGPPGCGKTGIIQAIANHTKRSIVMINLSSIKTSKMFNDIFQQKEHKDVIYVIEEIDCMSDVVLDRKNQTTQSPTSSRDDAIGDALIAIASQNRRGPGDERKKDEDKLNLGHILERLEGMESMENAIYIATSNHPEKLDKALTRPGRFGFNLKLSYCSEKMLIDIISMMYELDLSDREELSKSIPHTAINVWTPAEIIESCQIYSDYKDLITQMRNASPCR